MTGVLADKGLPGLPLISSGNGGCGSTCGSACSVERRTRDEDGAETSVEVPFEERRLNLSAVPTSGTVVTTIDMDLTVECNLRCTYCFKEKWNEHMEEQVAFDAIVWLLHACGEAKSVRVCFMGGEPLLRFKLIKKLVPFAKRRAAQHGKRIHFGMTTNGTLVSDAVVEFWKQWGMSFHTSIDGTAEVQDANRPTTAGRGSSHLVERAVPKILAYQPGTTARCTVVPSGAGSLLEGYHYFRSLGYTDIAMVPGDNRSWDSASIERYELDFNRVADAYMDEMRRGVVVQLKGVVDAIEGYVRQERPKHACGASRGLLLIDIHGDIWPCHRWNKKKQSSWRVGSIYSQFSDAIKSILDQPSHTVLLEQDCASCQANLFCGGGCPAENLEEAGSVYRRHANACELTRVWARVGRRVHDTLLAEGDPTFLSQFYPESTCVQQAESFRVQAFS